MGMGPRAHLRNRSAGVGRVFLGFVRGASGDHSGCDHARSLHGAWIHGRGDAGRGSDRHPSPRVQTVAKPRGGALASWGRRRTCGALTTAGTAGRPPIWARSSRYADERGVSAANERALIVPAVALPPASMKDSAAAGSSPGVVSPGRSPPNSHKERALKDTIQSTRRMPRAAFAVASGAAALALALAGCGSSDHPATESTATASVSGVVSMDTTFSGTVTLKDSSSPVQQKASALDANGAFAIDVSALTPPYLVEAEIMPDGAGTALRMHSVTEEPGIANVNPMTDAAVAGACSTTPDDAFANADRESNHRTASAFTGMLARLQTALKPLFDVYGLPANPFTEEGAGPALRALLEDVKITVSSGDLVVTNRATGAVIFTGALSDLAMGTFTAGNMPGGAGMTPPPPDGAALYAAKCASCHGPLVTSTKLGRTAAQITAANMTQGLTPAEVQAVADALAVTTPPPPMACTYTYSAWGSCQSESTQARTIASSSPAGCTGTPVLTQACTYVPPVTACTSFTYSEWGTCSAAGTQTRTVASSAPSGCTGGSPELTQACTPPAPALDGAALYAQSCASCHHALATSNLKGKNISVASINSRNMTQGLTDAQLQAI